MQRTMFAVILVLMAAGLVFSPGCKGGQQNGMKEGNKDEEKGAKKEKEKGAEKETKLLMVKNPLATPEETVKAYLDLDGQGKRLTSKTWSKVLPYISWQEEAGWDRVTVITGYVITKTEVKKNMSALVTVRFDVLGSLSSDYHPSKSLENVVFTVQKTDAGWKITDPDTFRPHVLVNPLITHLEETKEYELAQRVQTGRQD
jgi:hypothetical protein